MTATWYPKNLLLVVALFALFAAALRVTTAWRTHRRNDPANVARSESRDMVRAHRARLREQGLRPVQVWVADVRSQTFSRAAHRQSAAVARSSQAQDDQSFVDAISAWDAE